MRTYVVLTLVGIILIFAPLAFNGCGASKSGVLELEAALLNAQLTTNFRAGWASVAIVRADGAVMTWGRDGAGQLGHGVLSNSNVPLPVVTIDPAQFKAFDFEEHACIVERNGDLWCHGWNQFKQLGEDASTTNSALPLQVASLGEPVLTVGVGWRTTCAALLSGPVKCWGTNLKGQLGNGMPGPDTGVPQTLIDEQGKPVTGVTQIAGSDDHSCALKDNGTVWCWGSNGGGQAGHNDLATADFAYAVQVLKADLTPLTGVVRIFSGVANNCALMANSSLQCWGSNASGNLGNHTVGGASAVAVPVVNSAGSAIFGFSHYWSTYYHSCAIISSKVYCWGDNEFGELGDQRPGVDSANPKLVSALVGKFRAVATTNSSSCALRDDDKIFCWGRNESGQLGDGTFNDSLTPVEVLGVLN